MDNFWSAITWLVSSQCTLLVGAAISFTYELVITRFKLKKNLEPVPQNFPKLMLKNLKYTWWISWRHAFDLSSRGVNFFVERAPVHYINNLFPISATFNLTNYQSVNMVISIRFSISQTTCKFIVTCLMKTNNSNHVARG